MSVYYRESPTYLSQSLESLAAQTVPAEEIVIVKDGPLGPELDEVISSYSKKLPIRTLTLAVNRGLGLALRAGVEHCRCEWIARMDSDDICVPQRFEHQVRFLETHPDVDIVGSSISEFEHSPADDRWLRYVPSDHASIRSFAESRNPMNHMTVFFRKEAVLAVGNYTDVPGFEDYDLWVRMLLNGSRFYNLREPLVLVRSGNAMLQRRGSIRYALQEVRLFWSFRKSGFLTATKFLRNIAVRAPLRVLPIGFRSVIYGKFLRSSGEV